MAKKKQVLADTLGRVPNGNDVLMQELPSTPMQNDIAQYDAGQLWRNAMGGNVASSVQQAPATDYVAQMYGPEVRTGLGAERNPGMPPSVANFNGRDIVNKAAADFQAKRGAPVAQATGRQASDTPTEGAYVPSGIKPRGGVRTGDPFLDVNTDFGALAADQAVKDANDQAFTQMNRGRMSGIAATREAANSDRNSRLQQMGKTPDEIERIMYPERFSDLRGEAMANVEGRAKPARMSQQAFDQTNGRLSADSRTDALMRKARLNGQNLPYAQAAGIARNDLPTTGADNVGQASLPGMDPARLAAMDPRAGQVAAMMGLGTQRNTNDAAAEQGRQGLTGRQQDQTFIGTLLDSLLKNRQQDTNDKVATSAVQDPSQQRRREATAWLDSPAAQGMRNSTDPAQRQFYADKMREAAGGATQPAAPAAPGATAPALPNAEQFLASNPQALNQHLAQFPDPLARKREEARIYAQAGQGNHPAVRDFLLGQFRQDDPNLAWGPDHWAQSYGGDQSIVNWLFGDKPIAGRAADYAERNYGIPANVALPHFQQHYGQM